MYNEHVIYMQKAINEAKIAYEKNEVPVGAIIVFKDQVIAKAHNQIKTLKDPTAHAEIIAITQASSYLKNERLIECDLYVTIEPCSMCIGAMILARIKTLFFGAFDLKTGACGSIINLTKPGLFNHNINVVSGILANESKDIIQKFFLGKRK